MEFNLSDHHLAKYDTVISTYAYQYVVAPGTRITKIDVVASYRA